MSLQAVWKDEVSHCDDRNTLKEKLLVNEMDIEQDFQKGSWLKVSTENFKAEEVLPYAFWNEVRYFWEKGLPLGLSAILEWGVPPLFAMVVAGHTKNSESLQSQLGYGRVYFNCTSLIVMLGAINYFVTVVPGCIGAGRKERIPNYLRRSLLFVTMVMVPFFVLQLFARAILLKLGVPSDIAIEVGVYCRLMIITTLLLILEIHLECIFINLGYARCATFNSLITGIGIDVIFTYFFMYKLDLGIRGAAFAQIVVKISRNTVWLVLTLYYGLFSTIFVVSKSEVLLSSKELMVFFKLAAPSMMINFSGWMIYELQILLIANIHGISTSALAAGAIWIQIQTTLSAIQHGWNQITLIRTLKLLGMRDPCAWKSYTILCVLSFLVVTVCNIPLLVSGNSISKVVSNDRNVQKWFEKIMWVLVMHSELRINYVNASVLFIPMGKAVLQVTVNLVCFYLIATPVTVIVLLTDWVTSSIILKLTFCLASTSIAATFVSMFELGYLLLMDWKKAVKVINDRANTDKKLIS